MAQIDKRAEIKKKRSLVYKIFTAILIILFLIIAFPPIVQCWDRNDIWIGAFPLSQVTITSVLLLATLAMAIMYAFDKKYTKQLEELKGGNE
jgi:formate hydrogenlyase subunit 3/multisubunit Na+/H+ antiporter MnhD subunit